MRTRNQILAAKVYERVKEQESTAPKGTRARTSYGSMAHKLPVLIRTAGLAQALAFLETRGDEGQRTLLKHLEIIFDMRPGELATRSRIVELGEYMLLTRQCLDALLWFKRFAQSVLDVDASVEAEETNGR